MLILLNIILLGIGGLIAYWWANQGLFSAILHLLCVVLAGATAFAFWEPVAMAIGGSWFDDYAWAISLIGLFSVSLFVYRVLFDRLAPANVNVPQWANLAFGGVIGAIAAVLTIGIVVLGLGFTYSHKEIMGFRGWQRDYNSGRIEEVNSLWIPYHGIASSFFGMLSTGAFATSTPLRQYYPQLDRQATLVRDSYDEGRGKLFMPADGVKINETYDAADGGRRSYIVGVTIQQSGIDFGRSLSLTASQVRLIGQAAGRGEAPVAHPTGWAQRHGGWKAYEFDNISNAITNQSGTSSLEAFLRFDIPADFVPRFIQIRGTRFTLPRAQEMPAMVANLLRPKTRDPSQIEYGNVDIGSAIKVANDIRPVSIGTNTLPGTIDHIERNLSNGQATFKVGGDTPARNLRILGIYEPEGTRCVKVDVSRGGVVPIWDMVSLVPSGAQIALVDDQGNRFTPVGYMYQPGQDVVIALEPVKRLLTLEQFPNPSVTGKLEMIFYVTENATITGMTFGELDVGYTKITVPAKRR